MKVHHSILDGEAHDPGIQSPPVIEIIIDQGQQAIGHFVIFDFFKHRLIVHTSNALFTVLNDCHGLYLHESKMGLCLATQILKANPHRQLFDYLLTE